MADGSVIIDTRMDTGGITKGTSDMQSKFGKLGSAIKKIGGVIATAFAVDKLVEFGKQTIELGSDLQEVQNVVDVTFTTLNEQVNEFAKNAAASAGLSETMAKRYVGTFGAMADSFGFTEETAYEMSTTLTQLSGDVASFYNITQDEAMNKLKGVFTGETEALKELGVIMTQTALDAYAMENGFKKAYSKMTPMEQAAVRYQFVLEKLSAASGDFVRTQDSWANQSRILSLQWESLMATIGTGLINVLTPALQYINTGVMPMLSQMAQNFADSSQTIGEKFQNFIAPMQNVDFGPLSTSAQNLGASFGELAGVIGEGLSWAYQNVLVPLGQWSIEAGLPALMDALGEAFSAVASALEWLAPLASTIWNDFLQPLGSWIGDAVVTTLEALGKAFGFLTDMFSNPAVDSVTWFTEAMGRAGEYAYTGMIDPISDGLDEISAKGQEAANQLSEDLQNATAATNASSIAAVQETITALGDVAAAEQQSISAAGEAIIAGNEQIITSVQEKSASANEALIESSAEAGTQIAESYTNAADMITTGTFAPLEESGTAAAEATSQAFEEASNTIKAAWADMGTWFDSTVVSPINAGFESIASTASATWSGIASNTSSAWAGIVSTVQNAVQQIQSSINSITGKTVYVNVVQTTSGTAAASAYSGASAAAISMPMLAKGAVIPPNAPFAAILGDQKNGTNIEAPLDTIKQAVAEVIGEDERQIVVQVNINYSGDLAQLGRALKPVIDAEAKRVGKNLANEVIWE